MQIPGNLLFQTSGIATASHQLQLASVKHIPDSIFGFLVF